MAHIYMKDREDLSGFFCCDCPSIRFVGRWGITRDRAVTTTPGAYFEFAFRGNWATLQFDTTWQNSPMPHLWISVDDGAMVETQLDRYLRIDALDEGDHVGRVIFKSANEMAHRWYTPLGGSVEFLGYKARQAASLPPDTRKRIEFVGDSITEGVLIDAEPGAGGARWFFRPYEDDSAASYAWLTARALHMQPLIMGYGGLGVTKGGSGSVPPAYEAYPYCFNGMKIPYSNPDYIVVNHGANDRFAEAETYCEGYKKLLDVIALHNPNSHIVILTPFCGAHEKELFSFWQEYRKHCVSMVSFISTTGWIPPEPLHPNRQSHAIIACRLAEALLDLAAEVDFVPPSG